MRHTDPLSRYLRAVERRLPLPKEYKTRVLRDLQSSIVARREAGQSDAEIIASLGSPAEGALRGASGTCVSQKSLALFFYPAGAWVCVRPFFRRIFSAAPCPSQQQHRCHWQRGRRNRRLHFHHPGRSANQPYPLRGCSGSQFDSLRPASQVPREKEITAQKYRPPGNTSPEGRFSYHIISSQFCGE